MPNQPDPSAAPATDPATVTQALELELMHQRARREKANARRRTWRALSLLFLVLILLGTLFACFYLVPALTHGRSPGPGSPAAGADR